jgi:hypothetical protein
MPKQPLNEVTANLTEALKKYPDVKVEGEEGSKNFRILKTYLENHGDDWSITKIADALAAMYFSL